MVIWPGSWPGSWRGPSRAAKLIRPAEAGVVGGVDQPHVVDAGRGAGGGGLLGAGFGVGVAADDVRDRLPGGPALPADLDAGQVERVEDQLDPRPASERSTW